MEYEKGNRQAVAIVRVSSLRQRDNSSHDTQEKEIREYCEEEGLDLVRVAPLVESAKDSKGRKKYQAILRDAFAKKIRHIVYYMFDRESRNLTDIENIENLIRADHVVVHYVRDRKVFHKGSADSDFFMRDMQAMSNKQFVRNLRAKSTDSQMKKALEGHYPGNKAPLGYAIVKIKDSAGRERKRGTTLGQSADPTDVKWVCREFELYGQGLSFNAICTQCIAEGLVLAVKQKSYRANSVEKREKNPIYFGAFRWSGQVGSPGTELEFAL